MEVTSHALALHRVEGLRFTTAAFTNLSQDHLDFHAGMDDYFEAKASLFKGGRTTAGAVNVDDPYGRRLLASAEVPCMSFGIDEEAEVRATRVRAGRRGSDFVASTPHGELAIETSLVGGFNVYNCLAAVTCALLQDIPLRAIESGIRQLKAVPGRFESIDAGQGFAVIVDYAHTPDSLLRVLTTARQLARGDGGRVVCVFGCGGDRDRSKRPLMGAVSARVADVVIVTSDNPRSEDPEAIIAEIVEGFVAERGVGPDEIRVDRRAAIARAVEVARAGDVLVIAGKGHETGQQFGHVIVPFDDRAIVREALLQRGLGARP
jgi:UDP-N-acetylmuramoyl-L-alanyl-D-glutamate--2,6-diaminopimelate ligase